MKLINHSERMEYLRLNYEEIFIEALFQMNKYDLFFQYLRSKVEYFGIYIGQYLKPMIDSQRKQKRLK